MQVVRRRGREEQRGTERNREEEIVYVSVWGSLIRDDRRRHVRDAAGEAAWGQLNRNVSDI